MNETRLRSLLRETPVPEAEGARLRGLAMVERAYAERQPAGRPALPRLALALALATLLAGLLLSPAGAGVRDWLDDAFTAGVRDAEPVLTDVPGGGRLLVQSPSGPWVVQPDGSRRLLGAYGEATWSPRGLFVATAGWRTLSAIEPDGTARWSLSASSPVTMPAWSPSGERIAYRAGRTLRVVAGDGTGDTSIDGDVAPVPPTWMPLGAHLLAYVRAGDHLRAVNADSGEVVAAAAARPGVEALAWSSDGSRLLEATRGGLWLRDIEFGKLIDGLQLGASRRLSVPVGAAVQSASFSPRDETIAALLALPRRGSRPAHSEVLLISPAGGPQRLLFTAPGRLSDLEWSPGGSHLLIGWPDADQWLFVPSAGSSRVRAVGGISAEFDPGGSTASSLFPQVEGWCCPATASP
jgi:dipeptidyl aminopeptidase/acylaminoacyl peptidase